MLCRFCAFCVCVACCFVLSSGVRTRNLLRFKSSLKRDHYSINRSSELLYDRNNLVPLTPLFEVFSNVSLRRRRRHKTTRYTVGIEEIEEAIEEIFGKKIFTSETYPRQVHKIGRVKKSDTFKPTNIYVTTTNTHYEDSTDYGINYKQTKLFNDYIDNYKESNRTTVSFDYSETSKKYYSGIPTRSIQRTGEIQNETNKYSKPSTHENILRYGANGTTLVEDDRTSTETEKTEITTTTVKPATTTTVQPKLDLELLLKIIANLTYDYETNLTQNINETILKMMTIPTCPTPTTVTTTTTTEEPVTEYNATGIVVAKCFFCGMMEYDIPASGRCADAFAGDFLPLVPVDPTAKGEIARFRKYCRFNDVKNFVVTSRDKLSVYGRWTGGCSVRWIDLSGVYTQRTCRNRDKATLGYHFVSKRMAKLEMALKHVDNGCIVSPMATLVPFSRGVSLYARFHACVCTGNWCNTATPVSPTAAYVAALTVSVHTSM